MGWPLSWSSKTKTPVRAWPLQPQPISDTPTEIRRAAKARPSETGFPCEEPLKDLNGKSSLEVALKKDVEFPEILGIKRKS